MEQGIRVKPTCVDYMPTIGLHITPCDVTKAAYRFMLSQTWCNLSQSDITPCPTSLSTHWPVLLQGFPGFPVNGNLVINIYSAALGKFAPFMGKLMSIDGTIICRVAL